MENTVKKSSKSSRIVLVVEDEQALQEAIELKLKKEGLDVIAVGSGEDAINYLRRQKPCLVWLDVLLPGMNGLEVLRRIRQEFRLKKLPVVIVSVSAGQDKIEQALSLGASEYIVKSGYNLVDIVNKVKKYI